jgi:putative ABC transport system substrate-binding protein
VITRRAFVGASALALTGTALRVHAQRSRALPRLGFLVVNRTGTTEPPFLEGLRELGYVEGRTVTVERRSADGDYAKLPALAAELVNLKPDIIVAFITQPAVAAKDATTTAPIVMVATSDPVAAGIVGNLSRPGGNVTGTAALLHTVVGKQMELVRQVLPRAARVWVVWDPGNAAFHQHALGEALIAATRLRLLARPVEARTREELERVFVEAEAARPDAMLVLQNPMLTTNRARLAELAVSGRVPVFSGLRVLCEAGILASYGPNLDVLARRAASYVDKILKGAKPGDLAIELPTRYELVVNAKTARALGLTIPQSLLLRADEVIQ